MVGSREGALPDKGPVGRRSTGYLQGLAAVAGREFVVAIRGKLNLPLLIESPVGLVLNDGRFLISGSPGYVEHFAAVSGRERVVALPGRLDLPDTVAGQGLLRAY